MSELSTAAEIAMATTPPPEAAPASDFIDPKSWEPSEAEIAAESFRTGNRLRESLISGLKTEWLGLCAKLERTNPSAIQDILRAKRAAAIAEQNARELAESSEDAVSGIAAGCVAFGRLVLKKKLLNSLALPPETRLELGEKAVGEFLNHAATDFQHGWNSCRQILEEIAYRTAIEPHLASHMKALDAEAAGMKAIVVSEAAAAGINIGDVLELMEREWRASGEHPTYPDFGRLNVNNAFGGLFE